MKAARLLIAADDAGAAGGQVHVPEAGVLAWRWFIDLSNARTYHSGGPNPITYTEIAAYAALMREPLRPQDVQLIRAMDDAWTRAIVSRKREVRELTPEAFDAVLG